jgi:DNA-binding MarR family transcriptional regulator
MTGQWLTADQQRIWRDWLQVDRLLPARLNQQLQAGPGLSLPEYEVLVQLSEVPGGQLRPVQLGQALDWEQSRLSQQLTRMRRRGLVDRADCAGDGRGTVVVLTQAGRTAIERAAPGHAVTVRRLVFDRLSAEQTEAFGRACAAILQALRESGEPGDPPDGPQGRRTGQPIPADDRQADRTLR